MTREVEPPATSSEAPASTYPFGMPEVSVVVSPSVEPAPDYANLLAAVQQAAEGRKRAFAKLRSAFTPMPKFDFDWVSGEDAPEDEPDEPEPLDLDDMLETLDRLAAARQKIASSSPIDKDALLAIQAHTATLTAAIGRELDTRLPK